MDDVGNVIYLRIGNCLGKNLEVIKLCFWMKKF